MLFAESSDVVKLHPTSAIMPHYSYMVRAMHHRYRRLCANEAERHSAFALDLAQLAAVLDEMGIR